MKAYESDLRDLCQRQTAELTRLREQRDALLAACKNAHSLIGQQYAGPSLEVSMQLNAAIALCEA